MNHLVYEWDIETVDGEDILDHCHATSLTSLALRVPDCPEGQLQRLVLVRDLWNGEHLKNRTWAYVVDGKLPEFFKDEMDHPQERVPARFKRELAEIQGLVRKAVG